MSQTLSIQHMVGTQLIYFINTSVKASGRREHILYIFFVPLHRASEITHTSPCAEEQLDIYLQQE